eukprot:364937-Chlamydomonas_euryale.AAC.14
MPAYAGMWACMRAAVATAALEPEAHGGVHGDVRNIGAWDCLAGRPHRAVQTGEAEGRICSAMTLLNCAPSQAGRQHAPGRCRGSSLLSCWSNTPPSSSHTCTQHPGRAAACSLDGRVQAPR